MNIEQIKGKSKNKKCFSKQDLVVDGNDVMKFMMLKDEKDAGYWLNELWSRVMDGKLDNNRSDLIRWMVGVADGWIRF